MADKYWVGNGGDWQNTTHWSLTSGGTPGADAPTQDDVVHFDENSFTLDGQTVTTARYNTLYSPTLYNWKVNNLDWTGVTHNPTWSMVYLQCYGNFTLSPNMTLVFTDVGVSWTYSYAPDPFLDNGKYIYYNMRFMLGYYSGTRGSVTANFAGHTIDGSVGFQGQNQTWTLLSDLTVTHTVYLDQTSYYVSSTTTFDMNDFNLTALHFVCKQPQGSQETIYMGNGTWTLTGPDPWWRVWSIGAVVNFDPTIYPENSTVIVNIDKGAEATTSAKLLMNLTLNNITVNGVNLAGYPNDVIMIEGVIKNCNDLIFNDYGGGQVQLVNTILPYTINGSFVLEGTSKNPIYLMISPLLGGSGYAVLLNDTGADITHLNHLIISNMRVTSTSGESWFACNSVDITGNTGWTWSCSRPHNYSFTLEGEPVETGVYTFGSYSKQYPKILDFTYPISQRIGTEFALSWVEIGSILIDGNDIYVAWQYSSETGSSFGIDKLDYNNKLSGAYIETRVLSGNREQLSNLSSLVVSYAELPTGTDLALQYSKDYGTTWVTMTTKKDIDRKLLYCEEEFEASSVAYRAVITATGNDAPAIERADIVMR